MNEIEQLKQRIEYLEGFIANLAKSGEYTLWKDSVYYRDLRLKDVDIHVGTATGTKIGTTASQKLGFFGQTPKVQVPTASVPSTAAGIILTLKEFGFYET